MSDRGGGTIRVPNAPWRFSDAPDVALRGEPRYRGEDNRAVLAELLGLDDAELDRLESIGSPVEPPPEVLTAQCFGSQSPR